MIKNITLSFFLSLLCVQTQATIVEFQTNKGTIRVNLFDETTPITVANFLEYVTNGAYDNSIIHRSVAGFVIQGGGYRFETELPLVEVTANDPIQNEPVYSNVRGTIAMAKLGGDPNSATSQWFFNLENNASNLDVQNGGFTVFGQIIDGGLDTIDTIAALPVFNFGGPWAQLPLDNYTSDDYANGVDYTDNNLVIIYAIEIIDSAPDTAANLTPVENTLIDEQNNGSSDSSSGGTLYFLGLLLAGLCAFRSKRKSLS